MYKCEGVRVCRGVSVVSGGVESQYMKTSKNPRKTLRPVKIMSQGKISISMRKISALISVMSGIGKYIHKHYI